MCAGGRGGVPGGGEAGEAGAAARCRAGGGRARVPRRRRREGNGCGVGGHLGGAELPAHPSKRVKPNSYATDRLLIR